MTASMMYWSGRAEELAKGAGLPRTGWFKGDIYLVAAREDFQKRMESKKYTTLIPKGQPAPAKIR